MVAFLCAITAFAPAGGSNLPGRLIWYLHSVAECIANCAIDPIPDYPTCVADCWAEAEVPGLPGPLMVPAPLQPDLEATEPDVELLNNVIGRLEDALWVLETSSEPGEVVASLQELFFQDEVGGFLRSHMDAFFVIALADTVLCQDRGPEWTASIREALLGIVADADCIDRASNIGRVGVLALASSLAIGEDLDTVECTIESYDLAYEVDTAHQALAGCRVRSFDDTRARARD